MEPDGEEGGVLMEEIVFSCRPEELSCIIGNLFTELEPPCAYERSPNLTICGKTNSGKSGRLIIAGDRCLFYGPPEDLTAARNGFCPERRCEHG